MPSGDAPSPAVVNPSACFQPVAQLSILNIAPSAVLSEDALRRKAANEAVHCQDPLQRLRLRCLAAGIGTSKKLVRHFLTSSTESFASSDQFARVLCTFPALSVAESEALTIFERLSPNGAPIGVRELAGQLMPPMSVHRRALVQEVFRKTGPDDTGSVPLATLCARFDHRRHPDFEQGTRTRTQLVDAFLKRFEPDADGRVFDAEWDAYWAARALAVPSDIEFDWMVRNQWKL